MDEKTALALVDALKDTQPDTVLDELRARVEQTIDATRPNQNLTPDELKLAITCMLQIEENMMRDGNPSDAMKKQLAMMSSTLSKLDRMMVATAARARTA